MNGKKKNTAKYIDDIIKDLPNSKYTQRFREELLEHTEDARKDIDGKGNGSVSEEIIKKIGSKDKLLKEYREFCIGRFPKLWIIESVFYSFITLPILVITSVLVMPIGILPHGLIFALLSVPIAYKLDCLLYKFIAIRLAAYCGNKKRRNNILTILFVPAAVLISSWLLSNNFDLGSQSWQEQIIEKAGTFLILLVDAIIIYASIVKNFKSACPKKKPAAAFFNSRYIYLLPLFFFIGFVNNLKIGTQFSILNVLPEPVNSMIKIIYIPGDITYSIISIIDLFLEQIIEGIFSVFGMVTAQKATVIFIALIGLCGFWLFLSYSKLRNKTPNRWIESLGIIVFLNSMFGLIFFITSKVEEPKINWQVPVANISEIIEKQELGWFYPFIINYEISDMIDSYIPDLYRIKTQSNGFTISHINKYNYWIETEKMSSLSDAEIIKQGRYVTEKQETITEAEYLKIMKENEKNPKPFLRVGFNCTDKNGKVTNFESREEEKYERECVRLDYKGKDIWKESYEPGYILTINLSKNNDWAIITVERNYAVFVYLADLRK